MQPASRCGSSAQGHAAPRRRTDPTVFRVTSQPWTHGTRCVTLSRWALRSSVGWACARALRFVVSGRSGLRRAASGMTPTRGPSGSNILEICLTRRPIRVEIGSRLPSTIQHRVGWNWRQTRRMPTNKKSHERIYLSSCPLCHQDIVCDEQYHGQRLQCPICQGEITAPAAETKPAGKLGIRMTGGEKHMPVGPRFQKPVVAERKSGLGKVADGVTAAILLVLVMLFFVARYTGYDRYLPAFLGRRSPTIAADTTAVGRA